MPGKNKSGSKISQRKPRDYSLAAAGSDLKNVVWRNTKGTAQYEHLVRQNIKKLRGSGVRGRSILKALKKLFPVYGKLAK